MESKQHALMAAVAGLLAAAGSLIGSPAAQAHGGEDEEVPCYGINKCKGQGDCGGAAHSCAGMNDCAGKGYVEVDKSACLKIQGGSLEPADAPAKDKEPGT